MPGSPQSTRRSKEKNFYKGKIDGKFGDGLERAVRSFQEENGLIVDGKAGDSTLLKLYPSGVLEPTLRMGSTDADLAKKLQRLLKIKADGKFGEGTKSAAKKFQRKEGIRDDGVVDPDTWYRLTG